MWLSSTSSILRLPPMLHFDHKFVRGWAKLDFQSVSSVPDQWRYPAQGGKEKKEVCVSASTSPLSCSIRGRNHRFTCSQIGNVVHVSDLHSSTDALPFLERKEKWHYLLARWRTSVASIWIGYEDLCFIPGCFPSSKWHLFVPFLQRAVAAAFFPF